MIELRDQLLRQGFGVPKKSEVDQPLLRVEKGSVNYTSKFLPEEQHRFEKSYCFMCFEKSHLSNQFRELLDRVRVERWILSPRVMGNLSNDATL